MNQEQSDAREAAKAAFFKKYHWATVSPQTAFDAGYEIYKAQVLDAGAGYAARDWHPISDLPTEAKMYDITTIDGHVIEAYWHDRKSVWVSRDGSEGYDAIAWCERPAPYQAPQPDAVSNTCPKCRHQSHGEACFNMASDNECPCTEFTPTGQPDVTGE